MVFLFSQRTVITAPTLGPLITLVQGKGDLLALVRCLVGLNQRCLYGIRHSLCHIGSSGILPEFLDDDLT